MATLRDIRKRIVSVRGTQQITKAMKMVSAAKLRRSQEAILSARPYSDAVSKLFRDLVSHAAESDNPYVKPRETKRTLLLVLTSDRGLCGGFNATLLRGLEKFLHKQGPGIDQFSLALVGRKGIDHFRRRQHVRVFRNFPEVLKDFDYGKAVQLSDDLVEHYLAEEVDRIVIVYNRFISALRQEVVFQPLLPVTDDQESDLVDYLYEPSRASIWQQVIPKYLHFEVFRCLLDSIAGEYGARMSSMDAASKNAGEMITSLTLQMNRARQATITRELMEIISGKEAQSG